MPEISPGSSFDRSPTGLATTREEIMYFLSYASELEHKLACAYMFTAYSLKNDVSEGGLTEAQAESIRGWRRHLAQLGVDSMRHVAQISNMLTAVGGAPRVLRPIFSMPESTASSGAELTLEPFSQMTIERLATYERLDAKIAVPDQQSRLNIEHNQSSTSQVNGDHDDDRYQKSSSSEYRTVRDLYDTIKAGFHTVLAEELFIGPAETQADSRFLNLDGQLLAIVDLASACAAVDAITGSEKGTTMASNSAMRPGICDAINAEYTTIMADAQQAGQSFKPLRLVGINPTTRLHQDGSTRIVDTLTVAVADLFNGAYDTMLLILQRFFAHTEEDASDLERLAHVTLRLMNSVIRPLGEALTRMPTDSASDPITCAGPTFGDSGDTPVLMHQASAWALFDERLWQLATTATMLRVTPGLPSEVYEATAALQDLTCQFAPEDGPHGAAGRIVTLRQMQGELGCSIVASVNGPYLVTEAETLQNWLGEVIQARPQMALCRCGGSSMKPFCDGTHARIGFTSQKDPKRVPDHRTTRQGTAVTVLDNRGSCAHSGFCTDRLPSVFHQGGEPFVSPNGARMDEIIRAVRSCPSGALSYAMNGVEARNMVDQVRPQVIEVSKDGPYRITGGIPVKDGQGNDEPRNEGASLEHYSLCRCGHSQNKPFCSGMHWYVDFHDPVVDESHEPTIFEWIGGLPVLSRMTHLFYDKYVPQDPLLEPLFVEMSPDHPERVARWLGEVFGGPKNYSQQYGGYSRMLSQHVGKCLTEAQRARWVSLLYQSADEAGLPADAEFRSTFASYIEWGSRLAVENSAQNSHPPQHMPMPRWEWGTAGVPGGRISALAPVAEEESVTLPNAEEPVHFTQHIKPLFRSRDRQSMKWIFDLWSYKDVTEHADGILKRLQDGSMPCDGSWSHEKVETFQRWVTSGKQE